MLKLFKIKTFTAVFALAVLTSATAIAAPFTAGNVVIYRVGTGAGSLVNTGNAVFLDEYNSAGTLVQSIALPTAASAGVNPLIASGTASSEGFMTLSVDGQYLVLAGYGVAPGGATNLTGTSSAAVNRIIARVDAAGAVNTTTALTDASTGSNPRGVAATNGTNFWISGGAGSVRATTLSATTSTQLTTNVTNIRAVAIFNGQLYFSSASGAFVGVNSLGAGVPTSSGQTATLLPGLSGLLLSAYGFFFADLDAGVAGVDTLYVADDSASGGIFKFSLVSGSWTANGKVGATSEAYRGLTGSVSGTTVTLYATRKGGTGATGGGELVRLADTSGYNATLTGTPTLLATASTQTAFRGIAFAPASGGGGGSTPPSATGAASPNPVVVGNSTTLSATNIPGTNPTSASYTDTCNLTAIGGGSAVTLPVTYPIPGATTPNTYSLPCTVTDDQARSGSFNIALTVQGPPPALRRIYEVTGAGTTSPLANVAVRISGVVTAVRGTTGTTKGFYIESLPADRDSDPNTSEGLLVFIGSATLPACAVVGNQVQIDGTVQDFVPSDAPVGTVPLTELSSTSNCTVLATNSLGSLPAAVTITNSLIAAGGSGTQSRKVLSMRVVMGTATVVGPSIGFLTESSAQATLGGTFFVTVQGVDRPFHNVPGILETRRPSDAPASVPTWNGNPEAFRIDATGLTGGANYEIATGTSVAGISGIMDYNTSESQYQIYTNAAGVGALTPSSPTLAATPVPTPLPTDLLVVNANIERFYDTVDNGGDVVLTPTAYQGRLNKLSLTVRNVLRMPDIITLEEVEGPASGGGGSPAFPVLQAIVNKINGDAAGAGQGNPNYDYCGGVTNDIGLIAPAVIYRKDRVSLVNCAQFGILTQYTLPGGGSNVLNDRPPVVFQGNVTAPGSDSGLPVRIVVNHLRSLNGIDEPGTANGDRVRTKRNEQGKYVANLLTGNLGGEQNVNWNLVDNLLVAGDMNAFDVSDGYADMVNCIAGSPAPASQIYATAAQNAVSTPCAPVPTLALTNLTTIDPAQRYSYSFAGIAQRIDHVLVNGKLNSRLRQVAYARNNADFPDGPTYRNDFTRSERFSDHDNPAVYLKLPLEVTSRTALNASGLTFNRATGRYNGAISVTNTGTAPLTGPIYVFFYNLPAGVTLPELPQSNGVPYATINVPGGLAPGATSGAVAISFSNPARVGISYTTKRFDINF